MTKIHNFKISFSLQNLPLLLRAEALYEVPEDEPTRRATTPPPRLSPTPKPKLKKSASMKLKWFPAFRRGGQNHNVNPSKKPEQNSLSVSTHSLLRRSSSKVNL